MPPARPARMHNDKPMVPPRNVNLLASPRLERPEPPKRKLSDERRDQTEEKVRNKVETTVVQESYREPRNQARLVHSDGSVSPTREELLRPSPEPITRRVSDADIPRDVRGGPIRGGLGMSRGRGGPPRRGPPPKCRGCGELIPNLRNTVSIVAVGCRWHPHCFVCVKCKQPFDMSFNIQVFQNQPCHPHCMSNNIIKK